MESKVGSKLNEEQLAHVRECIETNRALQRLLKQLERESLRVIARTATTVE